MPIYADNKFRGALSVGAKAISAVYLDSKKRFGLDEAVNLEYLIVAGGGGGAGRVAGGGGAGGLITGTMPLDTATPYQVIVGRGGLGNGTAVITGQPGFNSVFDAFTAFGGGGGGGQDDAPMDGGSGGGERGNSGNGGGIGVPGQGFNGGEYILTSGNYRSGGGGGAGEQGGNGTTAGPAKGGDGLQSAITGVNQYYAGGGGGSQFINAAGGSGGLGGGGQGGPVGVTDGADGFGGGGGGGGSVGQADVKGGDGGDGSVRLAAPDTALSRSTAIITSDLFGDWLISRPGFGVPRFTGGSGTITASGGDNPVDFYRRAYWGFSGQYNSDDISRPAGSFRRLLDNATRTNVTAAGLGNLLKWSAGGDVYASSVGGQEDSNIRAVNGIASQQPRVISNGAYPIGRYALKFDGQDDVLTTFTTSEVARYIYIVFVPSVTITPTSNVQLVFVFGDQIGVAFGSATSYLTNEIITLNRGLNQQRDGISGAVVPQLTAGTTYMLGIRVDGGTRSEMYLAGGGFDGLTNLRTLESGAAGPISITNIDFGNARGIAAGSGYSGYVLEAGVYTTAESFSVHSRIIRHCRQIHQF